MSSPTHTRLRKLIKGGCPVRRPGNPPVEGDLWKCWHPTPRNKNARPTETRRQYSMWNWLLGSPKGREGLSTAVKEVRKMANKVRPLGKPAVEKGDVLDTLTIAHGVILGSFDHPDAKPEAVGSERDDFEITSSNLKGDRVLFTVVSFRSDGTIASFRRAAARTPEMAAAVIAAQWKPIQATFVSRYDSKNRLEWNDISALEILG